MGIILILFISFPTVSLGDCPTKHYFDEYYNIPKLDSSNDMVETWKKKIEYKLKIQFFNIASTILWLSQMLPPNHRDHIKTLAHLQFPSPTQRPSIYQRDFTLLTTFPIWPLLLSTVGRPSSTHPAHLKNCQYLIFNTLEFYYTSGYN